MPKRSGQQGNRSFGLTGAGKGDVSRITDVKAYRENFESIDWQAKPTFKEIIRLGQKFSEELSREVASSEHDWRMGL